jgi:hypothetical protein
VSGVYLSEAQNPINSLLLNYLCEYLFTQGRGGRGGKLNQREG